MQIEISAFVIEIVFVSIDQFVQSHPQQKRFRDYIEEFPAKLIRAISLNPPVPT
jgi:hypothetical protein